MSCATHRHTVRQAQALAHVDARRRVRAQIAPVNVFEREIRLTLRSGTAVEQARDVGMLEARQDLTLVAEAIEQLLGGEAGAHQLQRGALGEAALDTLRQIDRAHAALCQQSADPPGAELASELSVAGDLRVGLGQRREQLRRVRMHAGCKLLARVGVEQRAHLLAQRRILAAFSEKRLARRGRQVHQAIKQGARALPALRIHESPI